MISDFIALPGLRLIHEFDLESLLKLWPDQISDFGDATVATFDKRFARSLHAAGLSTYTG